MAMTDIFHPLFWPHHMLEGYTGSTTATFNFNADSSRYAWILRAPKAGTIQRLHFRMGPVTTGDDVRFSVRGVTSLGSPDGTESQFRVRAIATGDANSWLTTGILSHNGTDGGTKLTVTKGQHFSIVALYEARDSGNMQLASMGAYSTFPRTANRTMTSTDGGLSWIGPAVAPMIALEYDDGSFEPMLGIMPALGGSFSLTTSSTPDEYSIRFQLPAKMRCAGVFAIWDTRDQSYSLTTDAGSVLAGPTSPIGPANVTALARRQYTYWDTPVELDPGVWYRLLITPTSGSGLTMARFDLGHSDWARILGLPDTVYQVQSRKSLGAWTHEDTRYIPISMIFDGIDATGGGGPLTCSYGAIPNGTRERPVAQ